RGQLGRIASRQLLALELAHLGNADVADQQVLGMILGDEHPTNGQPPLGSLDRRWNGPHEVEIALHQRRRQRIRLPDDHLRINPVCLENPQVLTDVQVKSAGALARQSNLDVYQTGSWGGCRGGWFSRSSGGSRRLGCRGT